MMNDGAECKLLLQNVSVEVTRLLLWESMSSTGLRIIGCSQKLACGKPQLPVSLASISMDIYKHTDQLQTQDHKPCTSE